MMAESRVKLKLVGGQVSPRLVLSFNGYSKLADSDGTCPTDCWRKVMNILISLLIVAGAVYMGNVDNEGNNHEVDMQDLLKYCKTHSKKECHDMHAKIHMKHHGGTKKEFLEHYEKEHAR